ncbi:MAG: hypothetical protein J5I90_09945 [Caldilineales bacterium]|nr:hypothetical protein [Caldilineales bacterium]
MSDYRSHLSVTIWAALVTLALATVISLPQRVYTANILGSPVSLVVSQNLLVGLVALVIVCAGLEAAIRTHPNRAMLRHTYRYWALPGAIVLTVAAVLPVAPTQTAWLALLFVCGFALAATTIAEYHTVDREDRHYRESRIVLNVVAYVLAALAFVVIYSARNRSLISATLIGVIAGLLALDLLRDSSPRLRMALLYSAVVALIMAQTTWVINYWPYTSIRMGLALMTLFYLMVGLAHQELQGRLTMRRALEYIVLAVIATVLLLRFPI